MYTENANVQNDDKIENSFGIVQSHICAAGALICGTTPAEWYKKMKNSRYYTRCITAGRAAEGLRADWQEQLRMLQTEIGFEFIRFHGIFHDDMAIYDEDENGIPKLYFGYFDKLFDFLLSEGLRPILELGFMPEKLKSNDGTVFWWKGHSCPPCDYEKWAFLVSETVKHSIERYGINEVRTWYFEVWNEPNLESFWHGTQDEYFRLYSCSAKAIKDIDSSFRVGGPSTSGADFRDNLGYLKAFISYCSKNDLPVDFFSAHPYPTYWPLDIQGNQQMGYMSADSTIHHLDMIRDIINSSPYPQAEIHLTEWNSSPSPRDLVHDTPFMAPFILYNVSMNFNKIDSLGFWTFTDVFEENGPGQYPFHGGFGLISNDGIRKPSYWAYWFLSNLKNDIIRADENMIISASDDEYCILCWNFSYYRQDFADGDRSALTITERDDIFTGTDKLLTPVVSMNGLYEEREYRLNKETSAFHIWVNEGAPKYPSAAQFKAWKEKAKPELTVNDITVNGLYTKELRLQPHEAVMIILSKKPC